jgi:hypothetical protein
MAAAATKPALAPIAAPEPVPAAAKPTRRRDPLTMTQQRFVLTLLSLAALIGSVFGVLYYFDKSKDASAAFSIISAVLVGNVRDAFRHYFPGGQADQPAPPAK